MQMSYETDLKSHHTEVHHRLFPVPPPSKRYRPKPPAPNPHPEPSTVLSPLSTELKPRFMLADRLRWVAEREGVEVMDMISERRSWFLFKPRFIYYHLARQYSSSSLPK